MALTHDVIANSGRMTGGLAKALLTGIEPSRFARFASPGGSAINSNHPAFVYGHIAIYPARLLEMAGLDPAPAATPEPFGDLFAHGCECRDDPEGSIYPDMETITSACFRASDALLDALPNISEATLAQPNPNEGMRERMPTMGAMINFLVGPHAMMHLGQVSAWRRMEGLGPCM